MVIFKEKIFFAPLLGEALVIGGTTAASIIGGKKQQDEMLEEQKKMQVQQLKAQAQQNQQMMRKLDQVAKTNPAVAGAAAGQMLQQNNFAIPSVASLGTTAKNFLKAGKSIGLHKGLASATVGGASIAGIGYLTDKAIQADAKRSGIDLGESEDKRKDHAKTLGKAAIAAGTTALAIAGAKRGYLGKTVQSGANQIFNKNVASKVGKTFKQAAKEHVDIKTRQGRIGMGLTATFGAMPVVGYISQKKAIKDQEEATRSYAVPAFLANGLKNLKKLPSATKQGWANFKKAPGQSVLSGISSVMGGGGRTGTQKFVNTLAEEGRATGDQAAIKTAMFLNKHKKTALVGTIGLGALTFKGFDLGGKAVDSMIGSVDKNASKYRDSQNKEIQ